MASSLSAFNATVFALEYGAPLIAFAAFAYSALANNPTNALFGTGQLSTPAATDYPNDDTIYSFGFFDLSQNDVIVAVPQVDPDRWLSIDFHDPYGGEFATLGTLPASAPGNYLLQLSHGRKEDSVPYGLVRHSTTHNETYLGEIISPTTYGIIAVRVLVKNNGSDLTIAQSILNHTTLSTVPRPSKRQPLTVKTFQDAGINSAPPSNLAGLIANLTVEDIEILLNLTAVFSLENPPWNVSSSEADHVHRQLATAGIRNGSWTAVPGVNLTFVKNAAIDAIFSAGAANIVQLGNGWHRQYPQGIFGSNYEERAYSGLAGGYLEQDLNQTIYGFNTQLNPALTTSNESYLVTFSSKPPVLSTGFWSLTLYLPNQTLLANALDRYELGDRSNLTYSNGAPVYGGANSSSTDGSFQLLIQSIATPPPANWTNNWLPAPANPTNVTVDLRLYAHTQPLLNGSWEYPVVTKIDAIQSQ